MGAVVEAVVGVLGGREEVGRIEESGGRGPR
jgi:hypothetical protein